MEKSELKPLYDALKAALPKPANIMTRAKKDTPQQFICQVTKIESDQRYSIADQNGKPIGCFVNLPVAKRFIQTVFHDNAAACEALIARLCEQYKQNRIIDAPPLMELAAAPERAVSGDLEVWSSVPGAQSVAEYKESRPKRKAKGESPAAEEGAEAEPSPAKKSKKVARPTLEVANHQSAYVRASKNVKNALVTGTRPATEGEPVVELLSSAINKRRAKMAKHPNFKREVKDGALLEYIAYGEGGKQNPWYPAAQGDILVSAGSRKVHFTLAEEEPDEAEAPTEEVKE